MLSTVLWSASSWGCELKYYSVSNLCLFPCQPPREAVSWNTITNLQQRDIYCQPPREAVSWNILGITLVRNTEVSLLVRLWVEISFCNAIFSWSRVSLLVRLWVEISSPLTLALPMQSSASSWGCELKCQHLIPCHCQLLSASSWGCELKFGLWDRTITQVMSASSWGCELKSLCQLSF